MMRLAVFVSGRGSNLRALWGAIRSGYVPAELACVVSDRACAALGWAQEQGIPAHVVPFTEDAEAFAQALQAVLWPYGVEGLVLAGYLRPIPPAVVSAYRDRILNVHPALLPAFGGKGFYGRRVHEAVLASGVRWTGVTVHLVNEAYDAGPIVVQEPVPVLPEDTPESLQARVQAVEHRLLPLAVRWLAQGRIRLQNGRVQLLPPEPVLEQELQVRRALLSVSDKTGLLELARALQELGVELLSTGGTARALREAGLEVTLVEAYTGWPEMLGGRVKSLHPQLHAAILARRDQVADLEALERWGVECIDLVVVNFYPFPKASAQALATQEEAIEQIDIGGPALVRAAAKNHQWVAVLTDPAQYAEILEELRASGGRLSLRTRKQLAQAAFARTAAYEAAIAQYFAQEPWPTWWAQAWPLAQPLRYGENPHQRAAFYGDMAAFIELLHGRELSYNNLLDIDAALQLAEEFAEDAMLCAIFKHTNPCGVALGGSARQAWERALRADPQAPFGGIVIFTHPIDDEAAQAVDQLFTEIILAPDFTPEALERLKQKRHRRLIRWRPAQRPRWQLRSALGGVLVQERDTGADADVSWWVPTRRQPTEAEWRALRFAWRVVRHVKSNAIVVAEEGATLGIGAGQMSRVDAARLAVWKAQQAGFALRGAVAASDAFFPFPDGLEVLAEAGVRAVIQPGGSIRDAEVVAAADRMGVAMVFTGTRHFRH
ncbi:MAG: bifunctional phosphoribosylaminoimidazolecarboxamide formyltransferase/IMP cyclohydrolase [Bacteroidota bacterium]|nr:bifunctional phosphoribosylaminoimidazolecarboxamide formyltransferase/IMP cyclohydrolase [Bacteroidota bacterium]